MDITITAFPEEELAAIATWRSNGEVNRYGTISQLEQATTEAVAAR